MGDKIHSEFFQLFCEKNSDGTCHLRLKGRELYQRIGARLTSEDMPKLAEFLRYNSEIVSVDLCYNDIGDDGLIVLSDNFFNEPNSLKHVNLTHCDIHAKGLKSLSSSEYLILETCHLIGNKLGSEGARFIGKLIENCPALRTLDISETDQTLESVESILIVIEKSPLQILNISRIIPNSYYSKYNNSTLADDLGVLLILNQTLTELHVQKCEFDGHDVELLIPGLKAHENLLMLDLACNRIGDHGVELLSKWLETRPSLRGLKLASNSIRNSGARALSHSLPFSKVRYLDICRNLIEDEGLADLLDTLKKSCQIRMLFMWGNEVGTFSRQKINRMLESGVLNQEYIDVKIYYVDGEAQVAYYPSNHYKHKYYSVLDHGYPPELKIKRNIIPKESSQPRALVQFDHVDRYPTVDESLGLKVPKVKVCEDIPPSRYLLMREQDSQLEEHRRSTIIPGNDSTMFDYYSLYESVMSVD